MKKINWLFSAVLFTGVLLVNAQVSAQSGAYHLVKPFPIASSGGWDYIAVGPGNNRLYVSHGTQVNILNETTGDSTGVIPNTTGVHGIAFIPSLGKGYTSNGRLNNVTVFDLKTNQIVGTIATGQNPDAIMFDPYSKKIITCNGRSSDLSIIDPVNEKTIATIAVGGKPETAVSNDAGKLYVNIEDKNEIVVVNLTTNMVEQRWSLSPAEGPTGLAIDLPGKRLFAGCDKMLVVMNTETGKVVKTLPIGDGCDGVAFDSRTKDIFASCGEGKLSIYHEGSPDTYTALPDVKTKRSARTLAVDEMNHTIFLPAAEFGTAAAGQNRPPVIPGTFQVLVVKK